MLFAEKKVEALEVQQAKNGDQLEQQLKSQEKEYIVEIDTARVRLLLCVYCPFTWPNQLFVFFLFLLLFFLQSLCKWDAEVNNNSFGDLSCSISWN